jgi:hypothetical protein
MYDNAAYTRRARPKRRFKKNALAGFLITLAIFAAIAGGIYLVITPAPHKDSNEVSILMGEALPPASDWFSRLIWGTAEFDDSVRDIDTRVPGYYEVTIYVGDRVFNLPFTVVDNVEPVATPVNIVKSSNCEILPSDFYTDLFDHSETTCEFVGDAPPSEAGIHDVTVRIEDAFGNAIRFDAWVEVFDIGYVTLERATPTSASLYTLDNFATFIPETRTQEVGLKINLADDFYRFAGDHPVAVVVDGVPFYTYVRVIDTIPPNAVAPSEPVTVFRGETPNAALAGLFFRIAEGSEDDAETITAEFIDTPDFSQVGITTVAVRVSDCSGNSVDIAAQANVVVDDTPPEIHGTRNLSVLFGTTAAYREGVTVTDDMDPNPRLDVDSSGVNLDQLGDYQVTYTATDRAGNSTSVTVTVSVVELGTHTLHELADNTLRDLGVFNTGDYIERARLVHRYLRRQLRYSGNNPADSNDDIAFAYHILRSMEGNCIAFQRAAEVLLERSGIESVRICNDYATADVRHSWNLIKIDGLWYHFDATGFTGSSYENTHMFTASTAERLNGSRRNVYQFNESDYPTIAP